MMRAWLGLLMLLSVSVAAQEVPPQEGDREPPPDSGMRVSYSHKGQIGVHLQVSYGYRAIFRYDDTDFCGVPGEAACTGGTPIYLDLGLSYGVSRPVELMCDIRVGTEDFKPPAAAGDGPTPFVIAPGIKFYIDDAGSLKFFSTLQVALDLTDYSQSGAATGLDVGVRNVNGLLLDMHRTFGVYIGFGETIGVLRWLRFELDVGIGLQARFP